MLNSRSHPVIFGLSGTSLTTEEIRFFEESQPLGFILFKRNIEDKKQLKSLTHHLKSILNHKNAAILIDQEGGRVARLSAPHWFHPPSSAELVKNNVAEPKKRIQETYKKIAQELIEVGVTGNCAPLLDLNVLGAHPIMGDRTFGGDPKLVAELGTIAIDALQEGGITPIMKHIPGHGAALCDSHESLPIVSLSREDLEAHFLPFKLNAQCPWAMTAHIVYSAIDPHNPATQSSLVIRDIIRKKMGFKGFLVSDDLGMEALTGSFSDRARKSLQAGCDAVLHCSGNMIEMIDVMKGVKASFPI